MKPTCQRCYGDEWVTLSCGVIRCPEECWVEPIVKAAQDKMLDSIEHQIRKQAKPGDAAARERLRIAKILDQFRTLRRKDPS